MVSSSSIDNELSRILKTLESISPKAEEYGVLLGRYKTLCAIQMSARRNEADTNKRFDDEEFRNREFEAKQTREKVEQELRRQDLDFRINQAESEFKHKREEFARQCAMDDVRTQVENEKIQLEQSRIDMEAERNSIEREKIKNERIKMANETGQTVIKTAGDIVTTAMKVSGTVLVTSLGIRYMQSIAKGILSDEEAGRLVNSKLFSMLKTPNIWSSFKLF